MEILVCDYDMEESKLIEAFIQDYYQNSNSCVYLHFSSNWKELSDQIKKKKADAIIIAQDGVMGLDIITGMNMSSGKIIWFSDLDFAIQAYRLGVVYFNKKPITSEKMLRALDNMGR